MLQNNTISFINRPTWRAEMLYWCVLRMISLIVLRPKRPLFSLNALAISCLICTFNSLWLFSSFEFLFLKLQIVDFDAFKILASFLTDNLLFFLMISLILSMAFPSPFSTKSLSKLAISSSPTSLINSFQISCLVWRFLDGLPGYLF